MMLNIILMLYIGIIAAFTLWHIMKSIDETQNMIMESHVNLCERIQAIIKEKKKKDKE